MKHGKLTMKHVELAVGNENWELTMMQWNDENQTWWFGTRFRDLYNPLDFLEGQLLSYQVKGLIWWFGYRYRIKKFSRHLKTWTIDHLFIWWSSLLISANQVGRSICCSTSWHCRWIPCLISQDLLGFILKYQLQLINIHSCHGVMQFSVTKQDGFYVNPYIPMVWRKDPFKSQGSFPWNLWFSVSFPWCILVSIVLWASWEKKKAGLGLQSAFQPVVMPVLSTLEPSVPMPASKSSGGVPMSGVLLV